jgi:hypothetical protein
MKGLIDKYFIMDFDNMEIEQKLKTEGVPKELWNDFMDTYQSFLTKKRTHEDYGVTIEDLIECKYDK